MSEEVTFDPKKWHPDAVLNNESSIRSDSGKYNQGTMMKQQIHEELNSAMNWHVLVERIKAGKARDISLEPKAEGIPAIVIGSGPSLDYSIEFLKEWQGGIFCTTSHALTLMYHGIEPTHIVALDPFCTWAEIEGVDWSKTKTKLIAHPGVWPDLIENWPNEILMYIENLGNPNSFYATTQKRMYTWREFHGADLRAPTFHFYIPTEVILFACSPPIQMFMADLLGYRNIFLCGVDFAYHADKERFTSYTKENDEWVKHEHPFIPTERTIKTNNGLPTEEIHLYYKKNMLSAWRLSKQTVYTTDKGAIIEMPFMSIDKVIKNKGHVPKQSETFIAEQAERYLAGVGAFVVETKSGVSFVEAANPRLDLMQYMLNLRKQYRCTTCNGTFISKDLHDHTLDECPQCKNKTAVHVHDIDIKKNVRKWIHLLAYNNINIEEKDWHLDQII